MDAALVWFEAELQKLDLEGRGELYTHLLQQEIPFWFESILKGKAIDDEVATLIQRRGFNVEEQEKFHRLADFFKANAQEIRKRFNLEAMEMLDGLRRDGWMVAVHNDYRLGGLFHTFWLFTKGDFCIKGEGATDYHALSQVVQAAESMSSKYRRTGE